MEKFYQVWYIWSDGNEILETIWADTLPEAIAEARKIIKDSWTYRDVEMGWVIEIRFWNMDEDSAFCIVTEDDVYISDTIPEEQNLMVKSK